MGRSEDFCNVKAAWRKSESPIYDPVSVIQGTAAPELIEWIFGNLNSFVKGLMVHF